MPQVSHRIAAIISLDQQRAWFGLLNAHSQLTARIEADLMAEHQLSFSAVEVLCHLYMAGEPQALHAMAGELVTISRTRASRVVQDLIDAGHLQRGADQADGRISLISLTPQGRQFADQVTVTFQRAVLDHFLSPLDDDDIAALARIWDKLNVAPA